MVAPKRLLTLLRGAAVAATLAGMALMGHSGIVSAQSGPAFPGPPMAVTATDPVVVFADDDEDCSCGDHGDHHGGHHGRHKHHHHGHGGTSSTTESSPSSTSSVSGVSVTTTQSTVSTETLSITSPSTSSVGGVSATETAPPPPAGAAGVAGARAVRGRAPLTGTPATGADVPFGLGLGLTLSGSALLAVARWMRRRGR
jgi:hypothetical protein